MIPMNRAVILIFWLTLLSACGYKGEQADLVVHNARIYTIDPEFTVAEALAVRDGKIIEVGPEREILNQYRAERTYDAAQRPVYPGFIDAHAHFLAYGLEQQQVKLKGTSSFDEVLEKLQHYAGNSDKEWIIGRGWDQSDWRSNAFPDRKGLDSLFPDRPVLLTRIDGHAALANGEALERTGFTPESSIEGGALRREEGRLTGLLLDNAVDSVFGQIPAPSEEEKVQALLTAQKDCFAKGLTTVTDAGISGDEVDLVDRLQKEGKLLIRSYAMLTDSKANFDRFLDSGPHKTDRLNVRAFKFYADGALGSRGALLLEPYADQQGKYGLQLDPGAYFEKYAARLVDSGFQMCTHAIGDSANRMILDIYGEVLKGTNDKRWRIEHAQVVHPEDLPKFGRYTVLPSVQPTHATSDMVWAEDRLGLGRVKHAYAYRSLLKENGILPLGTDFPVEDIDPLETFYAAVTRKNEADKPEGGFQPEESLSREQALKGMTVWPAIANFEEEEKGTLEAGKFADMVVLEKDIMQLPLSEVLNNVVVATFVNGEKVYEK